MRAVTANAKYKCTAEIEIRFRDTDAFGHVNNAVYLTYLEMARVKYWKEVVGVADFTKADFIFARAVIDFRAPSFVGETLEVHCRVSRLGNKSFDFEYEIRNRESGRLVAEGTTTQVMYDHAARKSKPMPENLRNLLSEFENIPKNS